jgi:ATP-dependent exoDNAse (exonuclease V) beta subunit
MNDVAARASALDITRSWLVQAPAGSGKTALLIQRFLALLAHVDRPERIVATTFTRKAAAEMRERVLAALREADDPHAPAPQAQHAIVERRLAKAARAQDRRLGWRLSEQPQRLRIVTIDALAAAIARQAPIAAGLGALPGFVDDAQVLYRDAARAALERAAADDPHWQTFLRWQDNDAEAATRLVGQMLAARDRWPLRMFDEDAGALRADIEGALAREAPAAADRAAGLMPDALRAGLFACAALADAHLAGVDPQPAYAACVRALADHRTLPARDDRDAWCALADWLLTKNGTFLKAPGGKHGFPAQGTGAGARERAARKAEFGAWLAAAAAVPGLAGALHRMRELPPSKFGDAAWEFVVAAMRVLPAAADALESVFAARGQADFAEATLRPLHALGTPGEPTDLLLAIDYRLAHLLIDEFQDTSQAQLALIGRLTEGWEPGDGRTLFAVGDPMQSIYRFRQAEVRLFLEAQQRHAVGSVPVGVVQLGRNFRSTPQIVGFVNDVFASVLPAVSDPSRAETAYCPAYTDPRGDDAVGDDAHDDVPSLDFTRSREAEADAVVRRIRAARAAGIDDIAILVRARNHATHLLPALRRAGIAYSAVELEALHARLATRDLFSLARALAQPADRLAWLAILRAPWCGLMLPDLLAIADASRAGSVLETLRGGHVAARLTAEGRTRVDRLLNAIAPALAARGHAPFATRLRSAWLALGGPACIEGALDRDGADRVFALVAAHERGGDLADFATLAWTAERLFAEARGEAGAVQIMTLHKAKGLQFDAVILPALDLPSGRGDQPVLRWKVREHDNTPTLVLAPLRPRIGVQADEDPVYRWLRRLDAAEEEAELSRLLYVGATRARRRLHLSAMAETDFGGGVQAWRRPARGTALERLWDALAARLPPFPDPLAAQQAPRARGGGMSEFARLPDAWRLPALPAPLPVARAPASRADAPVFDWADAIAAAIGTVAHRLFAQVAREGTAAWNDDRLAREHARILAELAAEGIEPDVREDAARRVARIVARTLGDERGRWLFDSSHEDAHSEWALAGEDEGRVVHVVLDRSFVCDGCRYIVDFKTGAHLGGDASAFLRQEFERYAPQLMRYARIVAAFEKRPIRIALYYPLVEGGWQTHPFVSEGGSVPVK